MSARHQLAIACIILVTEITIVGKRLDLSCTSQFSPPSDVGVTVYRDSPKAVLIETGGRLLLTCKKSLQGIAAPLGFDGVLVFLCTLYAVSSSLDRLLLIDFLWQIKTRNLPENFNGKGR